MTSPYLYEDTKLYDYEPFIINGLKFRGPGPKSLAPNSYIVCIGASQTFGRYCVKSFPFLLSRKIDFPVLNLGIAGAGIGLFSMNERYMDLINNSALVIVQAMSARGENNSRFKTTIGSCMMVDNQTRHVDHVDVHMEKLLKDQTPWQDFAKLKMESQLSYFQSHEDFAKKLKVPSIFFWFSKVYPADNVVHDYTDVRTMQGHFPHWVDKGLYWNTCKLFDTQVQCVMNDKRPNIRPDGLHDHYYHTQGMMHAAADVLSKSIVQNYNHIIRRDPDAAISMAIQSGDEEAPKKVLSDEDVRLWILTNARSGSSYLSNILNNLLAINNPRFEEHLRAKNIPFIFFYKRTKMLAGYFKRHYKPYDMKQLLKNYPDMKFVNLTRDDVIGQAVSNYVAFKLKKWHITEQEKDAYYSRSVDMDDDLLYHNYLVFKRDTVLERMVKNVPKESVITVDFKDLTQDTESSIRKIVDFIGLDKTDEQIRNAIMSVETIPLARQETPLLRKRLEELIVEREPKVKETQPEA